MFKRQLKLISIAVHFAKNHCQLIFLRLTRSARNHEEACCILLHYTIARMYRILCSCSGELRIFCCAFLALSFDTLGDLWRQKSYHFESSLQAFCRFDDPSLLLPITSRIGGEIYIIPKKEIFRF